MRLTPRYSRILLKLSGESFKGGRSFGIENETVRYIANEIKQVYEVGVGIGVVVGGGNMWRGADYEAQGMDRSSADHAGMLATVMNALVLQDQLQRDGVSVRTMTAIPMPTVAEPYIRSRALHHLERSRVVVFAAGTGNPFMSTDTAASLRALEINAGVLVMAKNGVDGVYDADPAVDPMAKKIRPHYTSQSVRARIASARLNSLVAGHGQQIADIGFRHVQTRQFTRHRKRRSRWHSHHDR